MRRHGRDRLQRRISTRIFDAAAHDADDRVIYNPNTGLLTYDANGNHAGGAVAVLGRHLAVDHTDFLIV